MGQFQFTGQANERQAVDPVLEARRKALAEVRALMAARGKPHRNDGRGDWAWSVEKAAGGFSPEAPQEAPVERRTLPPAFGAPPVSRTGALTSKSPQETSNHTPTQSAFIDWLTFRFTGQFAAIESVLEVLGGAEGFVSIHPRMGYRHAVTREGVTVMWGGKEDDAAHVSLTGVGCRAIERLPDFFSWEVYLSRLLLRGAQFSRVDVAIDDRSGLVTVAKVREAEWVGRARGMYDTSSRGKDRVCTGETVYFGRRVSDTFVRIYNKALEQGVEGDWTRVEVECKRKRAHLMAEAVASGDLGEVVRGFLMGHLRFVEAVADTNRDRWPLLDWWSEFLQGVQALRLTVGKPSVSLERSVAWVRRQVAPTLAALVVNQQGCIDWLSDLINCAAPGMKPRHQVIAAAPFQELALREPAGLAGW